MLNHDNLLIAIALLFCSYASYTDLKYGKVPNICSFGLIYAGTVVQVMFLFDGSTSVGYSLSVVILSGFIAVAFYWFGIMAPGDAKLFWGVCMILPLKSFENATGAIVSLPPIVVLMNTLIIYFGFIFFFLLFKTSSKQKKEAFFSMFEKNQFSKSVFSYIFNLLYFIAFSYPVYHLLIQIGNAIGITLSGLFAMVMIITLFYGFDKIVKRYGLLLRYWIFAILLALAFTIIYLSSMPFLPYLKTLGILVGIYLCINFILKSFVLSMDRIVLSKQVNIADLKEGMIPAERIVQVNEHYEKEAGITSNWLRQNVIVSPTPEGMSAEKIAFLQRLSKEGHFQNFGNQLMIQHAFHFAPMILLGVILTILCKGPFYYIFGK